MTEFKLTKRAPTIEQWQADNGSPLFTLGGCLVGLTATEASELGARLLLLAGDYKPPHAARLARITRRQQEKR